MRIVADENMPGLSLLADHPAVDELIRLDGRTLANVHLQQVDALLVRSVTRVNANLLAGTPVKFVGSATIGTDHIDLDFLAERDIHFAHAPGCNARAVAEYVLQAALLIAEHQQRPLAGRTAGLVGLGNVGRQVARALQALGMTVVACDPPLARENAQTCVPLVSLDEALAADLISLHVPLNRKERDVTWHLLNAARLDALHPNQALINTCRGAVVDNGALLQRLLQPTSPTVVLDVWEREPNVSARLFREVLRGSPHIAGYSQQGKLAGTQMVCEALLDWANLAPLTEPQAAHDQPLDLPCTREAELLSLLQQVWSLDRDHQLLADSLSGIDPGKAFDQLRKNYATRHELHTFDHHGQVSDQFVPVMDWLFSSPRQA